MVWSSAWLGVAYMNCMLVVIAWSKTPHDVAYQDRMTWVRGGPPMAWASRAVVLLTASHFHVLNHL